MLLLGDLVQALSLLPSNYFFKPRESFCEHTYLSFVPLYVAVQ